MWRDATLLSLALLGCALLGAVQTPPGVDSGRVVVANAWLSSHLVLLTGGCLLHARWRVTQGPAMAWLATVFLVPSFQLVPLAMLHATYPPSGWAVRVGAPLDLVSSAVLLALVVLAARKVPFPTALGPLRLNPLSLSAILAPPCLAVALGLAATPFPSPPPAPAAHAVTGIVIGAGALLVSRLTWLRVAHRGFLVVSSAGLALAHDFHDVDGSGGHVPDAGELALAVVAVVSAVVLVVLTLGLFRRAVDLKARRLAQLQARVELAEETLRREEELLHEVRATIAGISTATYVLHGKLPRTSPVNEHELRTMLDVEVARVQRLLNGTADSRPGRIALDDLVRSQVVAQRALGHDVHWEPAGIYAHGTWDKLAEAVHVVLTNATRYADGGPICVRTSQAEGAASITVTDSGPGVDPDMRPVLFERGTHEKRSPGLGVGLYLARNAVQADGGSIRLQPSQVGHGATFVITIRSAAPGDYS